MQSIAELIRNYDGYLAPGEFLDAHLENLKEKYTDNFEAFCKDFNETLLQHDAKQKLPVLLKIDGNYIHGENVKDFFLKRVQHLSQELLRHYLTLMDRYIKESRLQRVNTFNSTAIFEVDIKDKVKELDRPLSILLHKPAIVAEAIIQRKQKTEQLSTVEDLKALLVSFFYPDRLKFKELQVIFDLNVKELYRRSFFKSGIIRQLIMRITGKHESYSKKFDEQSRAIYQRMMNESALPENYRTGPGKERQAENEPRELELPASRRSRDAKTTGGQSRPIRQKLSRRSVRPKYSRKEQDRAWTEFSKRLKE